MPITKIVSIDRTLADLRDCFRKWDIDLFETIPKETVDKGYRGPGMIVNYFRANQWQHMQCFAFPRKETPEMKAYDELMDAYGILGASPDDPEGLIKDIYRKKVAFYHPDKGGDPNKFKRLQNAYEVICKERGIT